MNSATGRVERVTDALGRFVEAAYQSDGLLSEWKDANGNATAFTWDDVGNLKTHTNARTAKMDFTRDGDVIDFTSPEGRITQYLRKASSWRTLLSTAWPDGTGASRAYQGGVHQFQARDGTYTEVEMQAGAGARFGHAVDVPGRMLVRTPLGLESTTTSLRTSANAPGDFLAVTEEVEETRVNGRLWRTRFDAAAKTYTVTSPEGRTASATLDAKLRPLTVTEPGVLPVSFGYDTRGRLASVTQGTRSEILTYDSNGFVDSARNALNEVTGFAVDKTGRLRKATRADAKEVVVEYEPVGNLASITPPDAGTHRFVYDKANEATTYIPPPLAGVADETTSFDLDGLVTGAGHSDSSATVVTREASGRVKQVTTPWWVNDFTYEPATGQVQSLTRGPQRLEWQYDGFLMTQEKAIGIAPATNQWTYDTDFRVGSHSINGEAIAFGYDGDSLLTQAGAATLSRIPATGQFSSVTVGNVTTSLTSNQYGELATLTATASGMALYSEGISYDNAGRISVVEEVIQGTPVQWVYGYDELGQLTTASKDGVATTTWTYDGNGNRLAEDGVISTFDAQDRLKTRGSTVYDWDALGGLRTKIEGASVTRYVHDGLGALTSVTLPDNTVVAYEYDGRHRRVAKRRNGTLVKRWIYDGQYRVAAEVDVAGVVVSRFVYGSQSHSPDYLVRGGAIYAYIRNHLGTVRLVVDTTSGVVAQRLDYDAWGTISLDSNPDFQPFAFAGGTYDTDTKLTHLGFRDEDSIIGGWTAKDPIRLAGGLNAYAYAANSPLRYIDPSGLELKLGFFTKFFYPEKVAELQAAIDFLNAPSAECMCGLSGGGKYDGAPWRDRDIGVDISPFVFGQNARVSFHLPVINLSSDLPSAWFQGTIAHEGGHFRFPYIGIGAGHMFADTWWNEKERFVMPESHCAAVGDTIRRLDDDPAHCSCD